MAQTSGGDSVEGVSTQAAKPGASASSGTAPDLTAAVAEAERVAIHAGTVGFQSEEPTHKGGSPQEPEKVASAKGTPQAGDLSQAKSSEDLLGAVSPDSGSAGKEIVPYSEEREAVMLAGRFQDLEPKMRNRLHQLMNRRLGKAEAPAELVAKWSAAKGDRMGVKQLALLKEWAKDPSGFGQGKVTEALENTLSHETDRRLVWVSRDDLEGKFHYLPADERKRKVEEYVASAKGTRKHPTLKGQFEHRLYMGEVEHERKSTTRSRQVSLEADLVGDVGASALEAMAREGSETARGLKRNVSEASEISGGPVKKARGKAKAKGASAQEPSPTELLHKSLSATIKKVAADLGWAVGELAAVREEREQGMVGKLEPHRKFCAELLLELEGLRPGVKTCSPDDLKPTNDKWEAKATEVRRHLEEAKPLARAVAKARKASG